MGARSRVGSVGSCVRKTRYNYAGGRAGGRARVQTRVTCARLYGSATLAYIIRVLHVRPWPRIHKVNTSGRGRLRGEGDGGSEAAVGVGRRDEE